MSIKKKPKTRSLKQYSAPRRSRFRWKTKDITPAFMIRVLLIALGVIYFAGFAVSVSLDETTGNPVKMIKLVKGIFASEEVKVPSEPEETKGPVTEAATSEAPATEAPVTEAPSNEETNPAESSQAETSPAESSQAETSPAESSRAETSPAESSRAETSPAESSQTAVTDANAVYAVVYTDENYTVKLRSEPQIPLDDKTANIVAEVSSDAQLKVKVLADAGESNGHKWSKVELIEDLEKSDLVGISDGVLLKAGTICYICTTYLKNVK